LATLTFNPSILPRTFSQALQWLGLTISYSIFTGFGAAEIAADKAEKSSKMPRIEPLYESSSENSDGEVMVSATLPRPAGKA